MLCVRARVRVSCECGARRIHVVLMDVASVASVKEARDQVAAKLQRTLPALPPHQYPSSPATL